MIIRTACNRGILKVTICDRFFGADLPLHEDWKPKDGMKETHTANQIKDKFDVTISTRALLPQSLRIQNNGRRIKPVYSQTRTTCRMQSYAAAEISKARSWGFCSPSKPQDEGCRGRGARDKMAWQDSTACPPPLFARGNPLAKKSKKSTRLKRRLYPSLHAERGA